MKKIVIVLAFFMTICGFAFAQTPLAELERVKQIKLLESTRGDVIKILGDYDLPFGRTRTTSFEPSSDLDYYEHFDTNNANIRIRYSTGKCLAETEDSTFSEDWNVAEWKVTEVMIYPKDAIQIKDIGIDYSKFRKEKLWGSRKHDYAFHNKSAGIAIITTYDWVKSVVLLPSAKNYSLLCNNEEVKKYYSSKKWNRDPSMKKAIIDINPAANVVSLDLSRTAITSGCASLDPMQNKICSDGVKEIAVSTTAVDPDNDVLTYAYYISGGKIIGQGAKVVWDLSDVKAGTYTITAAVDDGCGVCGKFITKTVVVKECPDCAVK